MHTDEQLMALWHSDRKIDAVRIFRAERNAPLMQAKAALEAMAAGMPQPFKPALELASGRTLRDHFAALAMNGLIGGLLAQGAELDPQSASKCARVSYLFSDAMLVERSK